MSPGRPATRSAALLAAVLATAWAVTSSCGVRARPRNVGARPEPPPSAEAHVEPPLIRIGVLSEVARASIGAESGVVVREIGPDLAVPPRRTLVQRATFARSPGAPAALTLLETGESFRVALVVPQRASDGLEADALPYRGVFEVRPDGDALTVVNVVGLEDYLRGVVPNELSPEAHPELEALRAQAVAARSYALHNKGQFQAKGYDLCATPACQVYRGRSSEHPLADRAVRATAGLAVFYRGSPIDALYTSACGGHTEDGDNVFEGERQPYLRGVSCEPERERPGTLRTSASGEPLGAEAALGRDAALLVALGVLDPSVATASAMRGLVTEPEVVAWTSRLLAALRREGCPSPAEPPLARRGSLFLHLVGSLCWEERARLQSVGDPDGPLQAEEAGLSGLGERLSAALLMREGAITPSPDHLLRLASVATRAEAVSLLARLVLRAVPPAPPESDAPGPAQDELLLRLDWGEEAVDVDVVAGARLFRSVDGVPAAVSELTLARGDRVSYVRNGGRIVYLETDQPRGIRWLEGGPGDHGWRARLTPEEIERGAARYGRVGRVRDVQVRRLGPSGRVVELAVIGTEGELLLRGLKIRWALGLRENLFVIDREPGEGSSIAGFVFTGKGSGHGVGLCQTGAVGMAQAGASFEAILLHYYSGTRIAKAY